jgi:enolase-phosphatase E1
VASPLIANTTSAILLDIEGTTTPVDFVYRTLFPYARSRVKEYLSANSLSLQAEIDALIEENARDKRQGLDPPWLEGSSRQVSIDAVVSYFHWLMDRDRKSSPLKSLQGKIWEAGYLKGDLQGQVFEDVPRAFRRWHEQGRMLFIYSSGSVLAQKLLFSHTKFGDLTSLIDGYFDTTIGAKKEIESYRRIMQTMKLHPAGTLFVSDVTSELDAAAAAGLETVLCSRPGNAEAERGPHQEINSFDELF